VLVSDQGLRGVVVCLGGELAGIRADRDRATEGQRDRVMEKQSESGAGTGSLDPLIPRSLSVGAGASLDAVAEFAEKEGLVGAEFLAGIPGTIGGGLHSNAGAFGRSLGDIVTSVTVLAMDGSEKTLTGNELSRGYRRPMTEDGLVAVEVTVRLEQGSGVQGSKGPGSEPEPRNPGTPEPLSVAEIRKQRWSKHPTEPSAGSFFRNPETGDGGRVPAGRLIEQCGLKGKTIGGAKVSEKHANFIVNTGRARFADVYELVQVIKATVEEQTGILLEEEVQYLPGPGEGRSQKAEVRRQKSRSGVANGS